MAERTKEANVTITVISHITLDGVVQAPGRPDEDLRDDFAQGGWSVPYGDEAMMRAWGEGMAKATQGGGLLLGRRTYLDFADVWPKRVGNPFTEVLTETPKYVASTTLVEPLPWENSILLNDSMHQVPDHKLEKNLVILGSDDLIQSLGHAGLIDECLLTIHPLVLGEGRRLFRSGFPLSQLTLTATKPTTTGVIAATYRFTSTGCLA
jgi:dihydrofolate reductase